MKETQLYVARISNFCTQCFSFVNGIATNTVLQTEWSPVRHRKYLAWTQRSDVACRENQCETWHPMWSIPCMLLYIKIAFLIESFSLMTTFFACPTDTCIVYIDQGNSIGSLVSHWFSRQGTSDHCVHAKYFLCLTGDHLVCKRGFVAKPLTTYNFASIIQMKTLKCCKNF